MEITPEIRRGVRIEKARQAEFEAIKEALGGESQWIGFHSPLEILVYLHERETGYGHVKTIAQLAEHLGVKVNYPQDILDAYRKEDHDSESLVDERVAPFNAS